MREIKFRAWYDNKMWCLAKLDLWGDPDQTTCDLAPYLPKYEELYDIYLSDVILMQSTGLKDENGVEIYEGDIVCDRYANKYTPIFRNGIYMAYNVEYLYLTKQEPSTQFNAVWRDGCEVIGNIYENPELLDKQ